MGKNTVIQGRVRLLGNNVDTDVILPGKYLVLTDPKELGKHALEGVDPAWPASIQTGDILVGGRNFGCGSSREQAPVAIQAAGISCVIAESFARIFFRNALNIGLPLIESSGIQSFTQEGKILSVHLDEGIIEDLEAGRSQQFKPLPPFIMEILAAGGLIPGIKKKIARGELE